MLESTRAIPDSNPNPSVEEQDKYVVKNSFYSAYGNFRLTTEKKNGFCLIGNYFLSCLRENRNYCSLILGYILVAVLPKIRPLIKKSTFVQVFHIWKFFRK